MGKFVDPLWVGAVNSPTHSAPATKCLHFTGARVLEVRIHLPPAESQANFRYRSLGTADGAPKSTSSPGSGKSLDLMMPSPAIHQIGDARHPGWLSAGRPPAYGYGVQSYRQSASATPAPLVPPVIHTHSPTQSDSGRRCTPTSPSLSPPLTPRHRWCPLPPRFRALALFRRRPRT